MNNKQVETIISQLDRSKLRNNTQRALLALLKPQAKDGWVARTAIPVKSATARLRELRRPEFGGFKVECVPAETLRQANPRRHVSSVVTSHQTFYRVVPSSVTLSALKKVFKGVI